MPARACLEPLTLAPSPDRDHRVMYLDFSATVRRNGDVERGP